MLESAVGQLRENVEARRRAAGGDEIERAVQVPVHREHIADGIGHAGIVQGQRGEQHARHSQEAQHTASGADDEVRVVIVVQIGEADAVGAIDVHIRHGIGSLVPALRGGRAILQRHHVALNAGSCDVEIAVLIEVCRDHDARFIDERHRQLGGDREGARAIATEELHAAIPQPRGHIGVAVIVEVRHRERKETGPGVEDARSLEITARRAEEHGDGAIVPEAEIRRHDISETVMVHIRHLQCAGPGGTHRKVARRGEPAIGGREPQTDFAGGAVQLQHVVPTVAIEVAHAQRRDIGIHGIDLIRSHRAAGGGAEDENADILRVAVDDRGIQPVIAGEVRNGGLPRAAARSLRSVLLKQGAAVVPADHRGPRLPRRPC